MGSRIVSTGSVIVDMTFRVPALPDAGGDVLAASPKLAVAGGFNLMVAAVNQGAEIVHVGRLGRGPRSELVAAALAEASIPVIHLPPDPCLGDADLEMDTGLCIVLVDDDAERSFITAPGAEARLSGEGLAKISLRVDDWVAVSGYDLTYEQSAEPLVGWLASVGPETPILLDPGPLLYDIKPAVWEQAMRQVSVLTLNDREARILSGSSSDEAPSLHAAIRREQGLRPEVLLVVRRGAAGCTFDGGPDGDGVTSVPAMPVDPVDTTGAGDTHTGVLLAALASGTPTAESLHRANIAAAMSVTRTGPARPPSREEVDAAIVGFPLRATSGTTKP